MRSYLKSVVLASAVLALVSGWSGQARAGILLDLIDPPAQTNTPYSLAFVASSTTTSISIAGYQVPSFSSATNIGVFLNNAGPNLLGSTWVFTPAASGSDSFTGNDGTPVPSLFFGGVVVGFYDTYTQTFATTVGRSYSLDFLFTNPSFNSPSGFRVSTTASGTAVPEPSSLALVGIAGVMGLGGAWRSRKRTA